MEIVIREVDDTDYPALLLLWNDKLGNGHVTTNNIAE